MGDLGELSCGVFASWTLTPVTRPCRVSCPPGPRWEGPPVSWAYLPVFWLAGHTFPVPFRVT